MRQIQITVKPDGQMEVKTTGYVGASCKEATKFLEKLGAVKSDTPTPEMYEETQKDTIEQREQ